MRNAAIAVGVFFISACVEFPVVPDAATPSDNFLCRYFLNPYLLGDGQLRLASGEPVFARLKNAAEAGTELVLPFGPADQGAQITFTSGWITFHGIYAQEGGLEVKLKKAISVSPVLTWNTGDFVTWLGSDEAGLLRVGARAPDRFKPVAPLRGTVDCSQTTIGTPRSSEDDATDAARSVELSGSAPISVSATPGGPPEGQLLLGKDGAQDAESLEERGHWVRIKLDLYPGTLTGWVPKERTREPPKREGGDIFGGILGGLMGNGQGRGTPRYSRCTEPAVLYVVIAGQPPRRVGELLKHAAVVVGAHRDGYVEVTLPEDDWIHLEPNVTWALPDAELARCSPTQRTI